MTQRVLVLQVPVDSTLREPGAMHRIGQILRRMTDDHCALRYASESEMPAYHAPTRTYELLVEPEADIGRIERLLAQYHVNILKPAPATAETV